ncbi:hypothetical protein [Metabacillus idriensis]|uniref:hypothetical protein n=1 Tax=Metabacillus idriensis TaxID=324768 RepID=UPI00174D8826|nr:hypothetical protein [Metabacillus idriensis]
MDKNATNLFVQLLLEKYGIDSKLKAIPEEKKEPLRKMVNQLNGQVEEFLKNVMTQKGGK